MTTDYSKTVIYKIVCNDASVTGTYVGSTVHFKNRISRHISASKAKRKECPLLYNCVNNNGGWDNFTATIIEEYPCKSLQEKLLREKYWINKLKANLNVVKNTVRDDYVVKEEKQIIIKCGCGSQYKKMNEKDHLNTDKHRNYVKKFL